jgi:hypothetical protein
MVEDFALSLNTMANQLRALGDDISDKEVIRQMLHTIPEKVKQVTISMETLLDLGSLSIEEAIRHLCAVEQQKKSSASHGGVDGPDEVTGWFWIQLWSPSWQRKW